MRVAPFTVLLLASFAALAQPYDSMIAGTAGYCIIAGPPVTALETTGQNASVQLSLVSVVAPAPNGRVFAAVAPHGSFHIGEIRPGGSITPLSASYPAELRAMVVDRAGATYVLAGVFPNERIVVFEPDGAVRATYPLTDASYIHSSPAQTSIDLAADQCTLFMIRNGTLIRRFDACNGVFLADFATVQTPPARAIRVLPDGGVLIATGSEGSFRLERYGAAGAFVNAFPLGGAVHALMLRDGGANVSYAEARCEGGLLVTLDLATGATLSTTPLEMELPSSIVVWFGWTAAIGDSHLSEVPATGTLALALIGMMLAAVAVVRLR